MWALSREEREALSEEGLEWRLELVWEDEVMSELFLLAFCCSERG
jgi:hypothetical protein